MQPSSASSGPLSVAFIAPTAGPADVAGTVVITGTGFLAGATVTFDGRAAKVTSLNATSITALTPTHAEGEVDLTVINPGGQSVTLFHAFTYARMAVTSVSPAAGIIGKWVRVHGFGFSSDVSVSFGGSPADVIFESSASLFALAPARPAGSVDVVVRNQSGVSATLDHGFTYQVVSVSANQSVVAPGAQLIVSWAAPSGQSEADWVGLFKVGDPNSRPAWSDYTNGAAAGARTLRAPDTPGEYEFRYLVDDLYNEAARSGVVRVARDQ